MVKYSIGALFYAKKNYELSYRLKNICVDERVNLINSEDFLDFTVKIVQFKPSIIFMDISNVEECDSILKLIKDNECLSLTTIAFISKDKKILRGNGKHIVDLKECEIRNFLKEFVSQFDVMMLGRENLNINWGSENYEKIGQYLITLGFNPKHAGCQYLKTIINYIAMRNKSVVAITDCYEVAAVQFKTRVVNIERSVRSCITRAWELGGKNMWRIDFDTDCIIKKPTAREFVCYVVEKLTSTKRIYVPSFNEM